MTILDDIVRDKRREVAERKREYPLRELESMLVRRLPVRDFRAALSQRGTGIIAEVKKASPSKGLLCPDFDPVRLAKVYNENGAIAISVLTESRYFQGHIDYLTTVKHTVDVPVLRKDFIFEPYQIYESAAYNADAILLIAAVLNEEEISDLLSLAVRLSLSYIVEVHNEAEIGRAYNAGATIIGINNRDLATFDVDIGTTCRLRTLVPDSCIIVSESGIHSRKDIEILEASGVDAVLVGESLVTSNDIPGKLKELRG